VQALRCSVATKLQTNALALEQHHRAAALILKGGVITSKEKIRLDLTAMSDVVNQLQYMKDNWSDLIIQMSDDELEKTIRKIYRNIEKEGRNELLLKMQEVFVHVGYNGDSLRQIKGEISTSLFKARRKIIPVIRKFLNSEDRNHNIPAEVLDQLL
jgi:hypothetical protein